MRKLRRHFGMIFLLGGLTALYFLAPSALPGGGGAQYAVAHDDSRDEEGSCYPSNDFPLGPGGPLRASSEGSGRDNEVEIEIPPSFGSVAGAKVSWEFSMAVTGNNGPAYDISVPGTMMGSLDVEIDWNDWRGKTTFKSDCAAELVLDEGMIEAELEGTVSNFPNAKNANKDGPTRAVATIHVKGENAEQLTWSINIELGTTCFEMLEDDGAGWEFQEFELSAGGTGRGEFRISSDQAGEWGRAGLPAGFTPSSNPCPGVFFN